MRSPIALLGLLPVIIGEGAATTADVGKSYRLYHKLGNDPRLAPRGIIKIAPSSSDGLLEAAFHPETSARLDAAAFDSMVENGGLYTLVVLEEGDDIASSSSNASRPRVSASVPGCSLRRSNLREEIGLSVGPTGRLLSASYRPIISPLAPKSCERLKPLSEGPEAVFGRTTTGGEDDDNNATSNNNMPFKTTVSFDSHKPMAAIPAVLPQQRPPPGLKWYRRNSKNNPNPLLGGGTNVKHEGGGGTHIPGVDDEGPTGFKSSFLYRYWYIILPLAIMGLFGGVDEELPQQAGGGGSAGAAATVVSAGATAGAAGGGGVAQTRQRRGKRD